MRKVTAQRLAEFTERDYVLTFGVGKKEFDRMLAALEDAYRREHKRKPRFTKITMLDTFLIGVPSFFCGNTRMPRTSIFIHYRLGMFSSQCVHCLLGQIFVKTFSAGLYDPCHLLHTVLLCKKGLPLTAGSP